ncbi:myosin VA-like protein [Reticulomyxa filosa]|uniref:Myosin VA-like protein n=1 Tax=Reticulomyxa filosa TaxID=46433 RepID=X6P102_RETFI|nr:myosin VA-like protein [Reticulomyxa filosa]|eukprot:ETO31813.1 myosin VA-like protein [Reticulomyxa filosa]
MSDDDKEEDEKKQTSTKDDPNFVPNPKELDGVPDLSMLVYLEMRHVLHNLHFRFKCMPRKNVYTSVSTILVWSRKKILFFCNFFFVKTKKKNVCLGYEIKNNEKVAINPYERLPMYGQDVIDEFHEASKQGRLPQGRPHPYGVSARSYMRMVQRKCNQSIIVCGESGAGKVE